MRKKTDNGRDRDYDWQNWDDKRDWDDKREDWRNWDEDSLQSWFVKKIKKNVTRWHKRLRMLTINNAKQKQLPKKLWMKLQHTFGLRSKKRRFAKKKS